MTAPCPTCAGIGIIPTYPPDPPWVRTAQAVLLGELGIALLWGVVVDLIPALGRMRIPGAYWLSMAMFVTFATLLPLAGWSQEPTKSRPRMRTRVVLAVVCGGAALALVLAARWRCL